MIVQLACPVNYDASDQAHIAALRAPLQTTWNRPTTRTKALKAKIRTQLDTNQSQCAYCGLELGGTSGGEIEHIAPKGTNRHPEFTYTESNLVLACDYCNGPKKKFQKETIDIKHANYVQCNFLIVHPYFDNPANHYAWVDNTKQIIIQAVTNKGETSINMFELDSPRMTRFRAMQYNAYVTSNDLTLDPITIDQLKIALAYK